MKKLEINYKRTCNCKPTHINCMTAKEWLKSQIGVWQFTYGSKDVRDKKVICMKEIELTQKEIERQDFVDNKIFDLINELNPSDQTIEWDIEMIGLVRDSVLYCFVDFLEICKEENFYPYIVE